MQAGLPAAVATGALIYDDVLAGGSGAIAHVIAAGGTVPGLEASLLRGVGPEDEAMIMCVGCWRGVAVARWEDEEEEEGIFSLARALPLSLSLSHTHTHTPLSTHVRTYTHARSRSHRLVALSSLNLRFGPL